MAESVHIWEKIELCFEAQKSYENPYREVDVWVDLKGPGFSKRVYGFWDGGNVFKVRLLATAVGRWSWISGSNQADSGLADRKGSFTAVEWTEPEVRANPCRRGFIRPTRNGHAFELADGTPFFLLGDTWWATPTYRYPWYEDDQERAVGPEMGFKDMVRFRKRQGFNCIAILAAFPTWANDGRPAEIVLEDEKRTCLRSAWVQADTNSAKDMHNSGGRPFLFPGRVKGYEDLVPDFDRLNPNYFQQLDRKIDFLNQEGFFPFIEVARRDVSMVWKNYYDWPDSYARYTHYVFTRYQANNVLLSPIHFDFSGCSIPSREYNAPANLVLQRYGAPPFGTLLGTNAAPSTLINFGGPRDAPWLSFHQLGNWREHDHLWYLTQIFHSRPAMPAVNGEPYYPGFPEDDPPAPSEEADLNCRAGMYGGFLSGGLGGYIYGCEGLWGGDIETGARYRMWEALGFRSGEQVQYLQKFANVLGPRYQDLIPDAELVTPNKAGFYLDYRGWAFCARTVEKDLLLLYFEKECPPATVRGLPPDRSYTLEWFDPLTGKWNQGTRTMTVKTDTVGRLALPRYPSDHDWGLCLSC
jgi:hypothetical protein